MNNKKDENNIDLSPIIRALNDIKMELNKINRSIRTANNLGQQREND